MHRTDTTSMLLASRYIPTGKARQSMFACHTAKRQAFGHGAFAMADDLFRHNSLGASHLEVSPTWPPACCTGSLRRLPMAGVTEQQPYTNQYQGEYYTSDLKEVFRLRHIEGEGQGGVDAYTNFGFTKFVWADQGILMLDVGGRVTNDAEPASPLAFIAAS